MAAAGQGARPRQRRGTAPAGHGGSEGRGSRQHTAAARAGRRGTAPPHGTASRHHHLAVPPHGTTASRYRTASPHRQHVTAPRPHATATRSRPRRHVTRSLPVTRPLEGLRRPPPAHTHARSHTAVLPSRRRPRRLECRPGEPEVVPCGPSRGSAVGGLSWRPARWRSECGSGRRAAGGVGPLPRALRGGRCRLRGRASLPRARRRAFPRSRGLRGRWSSVPSPSVPVPPLSSAAGAGGCGAAGCGAARPGPAPGVAGSARPGPQRRRRERPARGRGRWALERPCAAGRATGSWRVQPLRVPGSDPAGSLHSAGWVG